jgi:hypothetical protein
VKPLTSQLPLCQCLRVKGTDHQNLLVPLRERDEEYRLEECGIVEKRDSSIQDQRSEEDWQSPYGDRAIVEHVVRESSHGETASVQPTVRDSTAHKRDSAWHSGV